MRIKKHKKSQVYKEKEEERFPFEGFADCPPDKLADYAEFMFNKIVAGKATPEDFEMWIGWLEEDDTDYIEAGYYDYIEKI